MATGKHIESFNEIGPKKPDLKVVFNGLSPYRYRTFYGNVDFEDDDIPNWRAVKALSGGTIVVTNIQAGITPTPIIIAYVSTTYPRWNAVKTDTGEYDQTYPVVYNMTDQQFEINALDDGSGKALESYTVTINP